MQQCSTGFAPQRVCRPEKKRMWKRNESTPCKSPPTDYKLCCRQSSRVRRWVGLFCFLKDNKPTRIQMAGIQTDEIILRKCHHLLPFKEGEFRAIWALDGSNSNSQTRHVSNSTTNSWKWIRAIKNAIGMEGKSRENAAKMQIVRLSRSFQCCPCPHSQETFIQSDLQTVSTILHSRGPFRIP